ncbi:MAG: hypothetical protein QOF33_1775 [Thermomicrobiales bacterium]|nr:hypothetical protein [Thermomicrobiales bacterium]
MYNQLLIHEMVDAIQRERGMADAPRNRWTKRAHQLDKSSPTADAYSVIGGALARAGRFLHGTTAPRPEPIGSSHS